MQATGNRGEGVYLQARSTKTESRMVRVINRPDLIIMFCHLLLRMILGQGLQNIPQKANMQLLEQSGLLLTCCFNLVFYYLVVFTTF